MNHTPPSLKGIPLPVKGHTERVSKTVANFDELLSTTPYFERREQRDGNIVEVSELSCAFLRTHSHDEMDYAFATPTPTDKFIRQDCPQDSFLFPGETISTVIERMEDDLPLGDHYQVVKVYVLSEGLDTRPGVTVKEWSKLTVYSKDGV